MAPFQTLGVALDLCATCAGVWFDEGELAALSAAAPEVLEMLDAQHEPQIEILNVPGATKACPRCRKPLESHRYAYDTPVVLDSCPQCHGIFVEDQELEGITRVIRGKHKARLNALVASRTRLTGGSGVAGRDSEHDVATLLHALRHWGHHAHP